MFKNYFKTAWRNITKTNFFLPSIFLVYLSVLLYALLSCYMLDELSYDRFNVKADRTYRIAFKANINGGKILE
jgi:putative ABC transport system permease protein